MRKIFLIFTLTFFSTLLFCQPDTHIVQGQAIGGWILPLSKNITAINPKPTLGGELAIEFPSWGEYPWQQYLGKPTLGVGFVGLDLGNDSILGNCMAIYPYTKIHIIKIPHFELSWKGGAGLSFINKNFNTVHEKYNGNYYGAQSNTLIGSVLNIYLSTGINLNFPITSTIAVHADLGYIHMSNGSMLQPNGGINMLYGAVGASYKLEKECVGCSYDKEKNFPSLPYVWSINITTSGGYRELYYGDNKGYAIASLHIGATYNICNWYAAGGSLDAFYDGIFNPNTKFGRYILEDKISNFFRAAISINNEFRIGRITAILDWGIYLYDPIRLAYKDENGNKYTKRPLLYKYNIEKEDGWNYFRLGLRCRIWNNIYLQATVKTHLSKAEMIEWGIGYQIPFARKLKQNRLTKEFDGWQIYHHK